VLLPEPSRVGKQNGTLFALLSVLPSCPRLSPRLSWVHGVVRFRFAESRAVVKERILWQTLKTGFGTKLQDAVLRDEPHELYLARGRQKGYDVQDWLQAERELIKTKTTTEKNVNTSQSLKATAARPR
jgi:Protein of unknown function (DUF2934)